MSAEETAPTSGQDGAPTLEAIRWEADTRVLWLLDQTLLPGQYTYTQVCTSEQAFAAIREMRVRGAPAIAVAAALGLAAHVHSVRDTLTTVGQVVEFLCGNLEYLDGSRPTAVNLHKCVQEMSALVRKLKEECQEPGELVDRYVDAAVQYMAKDVQDNLSLATHAVDFLEETVLPTHEGGQPISVLTHCNTGSLATTRHGTALGVIRTLFERDLLKSAYATETRPYNQGARLTCFELQYEKIPVTLLVDSAVSYLLQLGRVQAAVVGADRVCANGDTINKIGTYQVALSCAAHGVPFFVAAPTSSIDPELAHGGLVEIEQRPTTEISHSQGKRVVVEDLDIWNPSFDVTPAHLIAGIFTEVGVLLPSAADPETGRHQFLVKAFLETHS